MDELQLQQHTSTHDTEYSSARYRRVFDQDDLDALVATDWTEERGDKALPTPQPITGIEYVCKICGEILSRLDFCRHMYRHHTDIYLPRGPDPPHQITTDFLVQTGVPLLGRAALPVSSPADPCRVCVLSRELIGKLRNMLQALLLAREKDKPETNVR